MDILVLNCVKKTVDNSGASVVFMLDPKPIKTQQGDQLTSRLTHMVQSDSPDEIDTFKVGKKYRISISEFIES